MRILTAALADLVLIGTAHAKVVYVDDGHTERRSGSQNSSQSKALIEIVGEGWVDGGGGFPKGQTVTLTATPFKGWRFKEWRDLAGGSNPLVATLVSDANYTAVFERIPTELFYVKWEWAVDTKLMNLQLYPASQERTNLSNANMDQETITTEARGNDLRSNQRRRPCRYGFRDLG